MPATGAAAYRAHAADAAAEVRGCRPKPSKLSTSPALRAVVQEQLAWDWSPQQISLRLRVDYPGDPLMRISHETIYLELFLSGRKSMSVNPSRHLRSGRLMRRANQRKTAVLPARIKGMALIADRPGVVQDRVDPGHWEGDLVMGRRPSAVATLVERTSRFLRLVALPGGNKAGPVRAALAADLNQVSPGLRRTLTWDRGREMAEHAALTAQTGCQVYFCDPRSPWQRGTNENINGLLRQYLAKNGDLRQHDQQTLDAIAARLNNRPRAIHGGRTPAEVYSQLPTRNTPLLTDGGALIT